MTDSNQDDPAAKARYSHIHRVIVGAGVKLTPEWAPPPVPRPPQAGDIEIYDVAVLARRLGGDDSFVGDSGNDEDAARMRQTKLWRRLFDDPRGPWRKLVRPDAAMIERLRGLDAICPHFREVTAWIVRAAGLALATGTPLRLDPAVVLGPPGIGKTFYARKLAAVLAIPSEIIAMNLMTDRGSVFTGLTPVWRASAPGKVTQLLLDSDYASPLIIIDEIEKASPLNPRETPENVLHSLFERENAVRFVDEFVDIPVRADHIFWFATANSLDPLPASIVDRLIVFQVEPAPADMLAIQKSIFREANLRAGDSFAEPDETLFRAAARHNPRLLSRLWDVAMGFACAERRRHLVVGDVRGAEHMLLAGREGARKAIGFMRPGEGKGGTAG
ncbi:ATPase family associated with various cellular activities (AAA) [Hyphomicrobiales bacterium]|nr:ATPase family associated with various cellular activities (AAA) [Hyphomicrobiales bacterium]CAH1701480.1 ATPase family associated with various cellular activities (AAA) [Hyphomicrobiales bacterium]CAI0345437.1 ATPase family associated with various cellular activities (AAA) [Hyphomicrobiales bacterium]